MNENEITELARQIRLETLKSLTQLGFGHYGGSMSVVETLAILYGAVMIYASTEMIDGLIDRADARKLAIIVTGRGDETARALMDELRRGVTVLPATGAYTGESRSVLLCVVEIRQLFELKRLVGRIDPAAFVVVANAAETLGAGFKPIGPP